MDTRATVAMELDFREERDLEFIAIEVKGLRGQGVRVDVPVDI